MQEYEGYFENGEFTPIGKSIKITGRRRAIMLVLDEPTQLSSEEKAFRTAWLKKLDEAIILSVNEDLPDFKRSSAMREPSDLID